MKHTIYLDHAAATPVAPNVLKAMRPYMAELYFNPSATYLAAKQVSKDIESARASIARCLGVRPAEIIFTAGGTEANNLAVSGIMQKYSDGNIVVGAFEHESVLAPAHQYDCFEASVLHNGAVDTVDIKKKINDKTVLVSIMYANNEIGTIQPIAEIGQIIKEIRAARTAKGNVRPLYLHTDAAQAGNYLHLFAEKLGVDLMTVNAGKLYGPKQTGLLYVRAGIELDAQILGGGQEFNLRSGTENAANIIGFAEALKTAQSMRAEEAKRLNELRLIFIELLKKKVPGARLSASYKHVLPNNVHIIIPGYDNERLMMSLDEAGIMCAVGSACSASNDEPSHVLGAIGLSDADARASLRFTMGRGTTKQEIGQTVEELAKLIV